MYYNFVYIIHDLIEIGMFKKVLKNSWVKLWTFKLQINNVNNNNNNKEECKISVQYTFFSTECMLITV